MICTRQFGSKIIFQINKVFLLRNKNQISNAPQSLDILVLWWQVFLLEFVLVFVSLHIVVPGVIFPIAKLKFHLFGRKEFCNVVVIETISKFYNKKHFKTCLLNSKNLILGNLIPIFQTTRMHLPLILTFFFCIFFSPWKIGRYGRTRLECCFAIIFFKYFFNIFYIFFLFKYISTRYFTWALFIFFRHSLSLNLIIN